MDARRPGAVGHEEDSASAWLNYFGWLRERAGGGSAEGATSPAARPLAQILHEALADTPVAVQLRSGHMVHVYAKSLDTLIWLEALDADLATARAQLAGTLVDEALEDGAASSPVHARLLERLLTGLALRLFVWALTTEGPGLPFSERDENPEPPDWTRALHVEDIEALYRAHLQVNREDLDFIAAAFPADARPGGTRLPLSGFVGAMAHEWGLPARQIMQQWTMRMLYASAIAAAQSSREATAAADRARGSG